MIRMLASAASGGAGPLPFPLTAAQTLTYRRDELTPYEQVEILDFPRVYYTGAGSSCPRPLPLMCKAAYAASSRAPGHGFDAPDGSYARVVPGDHLGYRYEIVSELGAGSFGQVLQCLDHATGAMVAVKLVKAKKRLKQQAAIEAQLLERVRDCDDGERQRAAAEAALAVLVAADAAAPRVSPHRFGGAGAAAAPQARDAAGRLAASPYRRHPLSPTPLTPRPPPTALSSPTSRPPGPRSPLARRRQMMAPGARVDDIVAACQTDHGPAVAERAAAAARDAAAAVNNHVVRIADHSTFRGHMMMVFPLLSLNLYDLLRRNGFRPLSLNLVRRVAAQIAQALAFLRRADIVHADMKPENVCLVSPTRSAVQVIDFGSSLRSGQIRFTYIQSRFYRAPEVILQLPYSHPIDVWSFGCILAELLTGEPLFAGADEVEQLACFAEVLGSPPKSMADVSPRASKFFAAGTNTLLSLVNARGRRREPGSLALAAALKVPAEAASLDAASPADRARAVRAASAGEPTVLQLLSLLDGCLRWTPSDRLTPAQLLLHPFIAPAVTKGPLPADCAAARPAPRAGYARDDDAADTSAPLAAVADVGPRHAPQLGGMALTAAGTEWQTATATQVTVEAPAALPSPAGATLQASTIEPVAVVGGAAEAQVGRQSGTVAGERGDRSPPAPLATHSTDIVIDRRPDLLIASEEAPPPVSCHTAAPMTASAATRVAPSTVQAVTATRPPVMSDAAQSPLTTPAARHATAATAFSQRHLAWGGTFPSADDARPAPQAAAGAALARPPAASPHFAAFEGASLWETTSLVLSPLKAVHRGRRWLRRPDAVEDASRTAPSSAVPSPPNSRGKHGGVGTVAHARRAARDSIGHAAAATPAPAHSGQALAGGAATPAPADDDRDAAREPSRSRSRSAGGAAVASTAAMDADRGWRRVLPNVAAHLQRHHARAAGVHAVPHAHVRADSSILDAAVLAAEEELVAEARAEAAAREGAHGDGATGAVVIRPAAAMADVGLQQLQATHDSMHTSTPHHGIMGKGSRAALSVPASRRASAVAPTLRSPALPGAAKRAGNSSVPPTNRK